MKTKTTTYSKKLNPSNPNGGFDVTKVTDSMKERGGWFGRTVVKTKSKIERNYNNPETASTQVVKTKRVYRNGQEVKSKFK